MAWKLFEGDCLEIMPLEIEDKSIDMILCDLPYGTTACKWDTIIPFKPLWREYERIIKDNGAIVLTGSQPFTSALVMGNPKMFRYEWIWEKSNGGGFLSANKMPLKRHENVLVFYKSLPTYNPQMTKGVKYSTTSSCGGGHLGEVQSKKVAGWVTKNDGQRYPISYQFFSNDVGLHPTQKPVKLFEYLIKTYTNEGDLVLDNCAGSGTTGVACEITNRNSILIEKEPNYCDIIRNRLSEINLEQYQPERVHKPLTSF